MLQLVRNESPRGFGANHNRALESGNEPFVCVLNPDVELMSDEPFVALVQAAVAAGVGCAYPQQLNGTGQLQDSERAIPTPWALVRRYLIQRHETTVDWVNAACLVLPRTVWQSVSGFDERYFMYCEDVDLCLRLRLAGWSLARAEARVLHAGSRTSHRSLRHLLWHMGGLLRLWRSTAYARAKRMRNGTNAGSKPVAHR